MRAWWIGGLVTLAACGTPNRDFLKGTTPDLTDGGTADAAPTNTNTGACSVPTMTAAKLQIVNVTSMALQIVYVDSTCAQMTVVTTGVSAGTTVPTVVGDVWHVNDAATGTFLREILINHPPLQVEVFQ